MTSMAIEGTPPPEMKTYILEGSRMRMQADFHGEAQRELGIFKGYGWNLDALNDVLSDDELMEAKHPFRVIWKDARPSNPEWVGHFGDIVELMSNADGIEL